MTFAAVQWPLAAQSFCVADDKPEALQVGAALELSVSFDLATSLFVRRVAQVAGDRPEARWVDLRSAQKLQSFAGPPRA